MSTALYAPVLGYYVTPRVLFGAAGDFVTAPELSPLFAACLANGVADLLGRTGGGDVVEFGAGCGALAVESLQRALPAPMPAGYVSEWRPGQRDWLASSTRTLSCGAILVVDYGLPRAQYYHPSRDGGTLCGFRQHRRVAPPHLHRAVRVLMRKVLAALVVTAAAVVLLAAYDTKPPTAFGPRTS